MSKFVQQANLILQTIADQPDQTWTRTQRELGEKLGLQQSELSLLLKFLREEEKIKQGDPIPGRGKSYTFVLVDGEPLDDSVRRPKAKTRDRALEPEEEMGGRYNLADVSLDKIGLAVVRYIRSSLNHEEQYLQLRTEHIERTRTFRQQLDDERKLRHHLVDEKEQLERRVQKLDGEVLKLRTEINKLLVRASGQSHREGGGYQLRDLIDERDLQVLQNLMTEKPGFYREGDSELGLAAS